MVSFDNRIVRGKTWCCMIRPYFDILKVFPFKSKAQKNPYDHPYSSPYIKLLRNICLESAANTCTPGDRW